MKLRLLTMRCFLKLALAFTCGAISSGFATAEIVVDSHGFEIPFFTTTFAGTGQLVGQTPATVNGTWLDMAFGSSTAVLENTTASTGSQAVRVDRAPNSDGRWAVPVSSYPSPGRNFIDINWDMRVKQTVGPSNSFGPYFCVEAYEDDSLTVGLLGSFGVDASTGEILYQAANTGFLIAPGPTVAFDSWNHFQIHLDYLLHKYSVSLNGTQIRTEGFVDQTNVSGGLNHFTNADISALAAAGNPGSLALTGRAFYDNFTVTEGPSGTAKKLGDFNVDGAVDAADYTVWRDNLGSHFDLGGNGNEENASAGIVDMSDYVTWKDHMGPAGGGIIIDMPEPTTVFLGLTALFGLATGLRRNKSTIQDIAPYSPTPRR